MQQVERGLARLGLRQVPDDDQRNWVRFVVGLLVGAAIGAVIARLLASREDEEFAPPPLIESGPDAILLRERPNPRAVDEDAPITLPDTAPAPVASLATDEGGEVAEQSAQPAVGLTATLQGSEAEPDVIPVVDAAAADMVTPVDGACPATHPIKGNHSSGGEYIYHLPEGRLYSRTNAEACFATEAAAEAAGYRRSKL